MKTQTKHTPGPWTTYTLNDSVNVEYCDDNLRSIIARVREADLCPEHGTTEANARLIAAAPELLEELKFVVAMLDQPVTRRLCAESSIFRADVAVILKHANLVIAKAEGGAS